MFWSDPNLYGVSLPYKDITTPVQTPMMGPVFSPWQNLPRFIPTSGFTPPYYNIPQMSQLGFGVPQIPQMGFNVPQIPQLGFNVPQIPQLGFNTALTSQPGFNVPQVPFDPWTQARTINPFLHYNLNLPLFHPYRQFTF